MDNLRLLVSSFPQALIAGVAIAVACSMLGVYVILKRVVFIGIVLSEVAACGVATAMICHFHPFLGASVLTVAAVLLLAFPFGNRRIPRDAVLGVIFVLASALSILLVAKSGFGLEEVKNLLYGDLIFTTTSDLAAILAVMLPVIAFLLIFSRPVLYSFLDRDAARVLGIRPVLWEFLYFFALGLAVAAASKTAGALLVFCYLVVAPAAGLVLGRRLWAVFAISVATAVASTLGGMYLALAKDLPTNQSISVLACALFVVSASVGKGLHSARKLRANGPPVIRRKR